MDYEKLKQEKFPTLYDLLFNACETKVSPQGSIRINSEKIDHKNFSDFFLRLTKEPQFKEFSSLLTEAPTPNVFFEDFRRGLKAFQVSLKYSGSKGIDVIKDFSYEVVFVDDGSTDRTVEEIKKIDDGIAAKMAEINGMLATPTRINCSPE